MENQQITENLIRNVESAIRLVTEARKHLIRDLVSLILNVAGEEPVTFNDSTGYLQYVDYNEGCVPIVAVRVVFKNGKAAIEFNSMCDEDDDYGLDPNGWFGSDQYGTFDVEDLLGCIKNAIESQA